MMVRGMTWVVTAIFVTTTTVEHASGFRQLSLPTFCAHRVPLGARMHIQSLANGRGELLQSSDMTRHHGRHSLLFMTSSLSEKLLEKLPSPAVVDAVTRSQQQQASGVGTVVASDVAATAGVSLSRAASELVTLAAITRAQVAVTRDGEIMYTFPTNLSAELAQRSAKYKALQTWEQTVWPVAFWVIRVSFGVALLVSLVAIFSTIFFIQTSSSSSNDDDRRRDDRGGGWGGGGMFGGYWGPSPFDVFFYRPYGTYGYYGSGAMETRDPNDMGFLESIFSYLFGDGNPNVGLEEQRLSLAAAVIRENNGAVTAEQLAPFCDDAPSVNTAADATYVDESFVLPIVSALGGEPVVTADGEIAYVFSELQTTTTSSATSVRRQSDGSNRAAAMVLKRAGMKADASSRDIMQVLNYNGISTRGVVEKSDLVQLLGSALPPMSAAEQSRFDAETIDPTMLQERELTFSLASDLNKFLAGGLGVVNLGGALYLGNLLSQVAAYGVQLPSYFGVVQALYPFLLGYAVLFNIIPLARNFAIQQQNAQIRERNARRKSWRQALTAAVKNTNNRIANKLRAVAQYQTKTRQIGSKASDIAYDTSKPLEDLTKQKDKQALADFDKMMEGDNTAFQ